MKLPKNFDKTIEEMTDEELIEFSENEVKEWRKFINLIKKGKRKDLVFKI
jgi:cell fate regulator YaaT (PSP1 superfamily)